MVMGDVLERPVDPCPMCGGEMKRFGDMVTMGAWVGDEFTLYHGKIIFGKCKECDWREREVEW